MSTCPYCQREFSGNKLNARHLAKCNPDLTQKTPPCLCGHESSSATQMKRHRQGCPTWQARDRQSVRRVRMEATSLERYGVTDASHAPEVQARRAATNLDRYGAGNPFSREASTFEKVQESLEGKRPVLKGDANPFARPEVQEKIRRHWQREHGVGGPQQVPEIRALTKVTNEERYGGELLGSPELRAKSAATNLARYGAEFAGGTSVVQAKVIATNLARYGVPHTCMDPAVRRKQLEAMEARYGSHYFASEVGKVEVRAALMEKYGVEFPGAIEGHWEKVLVTFRQNYPDLAWPGMTARPRQGANKLEQQVGGMCPQLMFTGDGSFWRNLSKLGHHKNPDFIVPGPDPEHPKRGVTKVVEVFGNFWHARMFTGKANWDHEQELIDAYAEIGIECLILWESEVKHDPEGVRSRLAAFVG